LGYGSTNDVGDNETPGSAGAVKLGPRRTAVAVSAGRWHSCALIDAAEVRCWGEGSFLGYGNTTTIGDDETPDTAGPVSLGD
jgi:Regulator of chromosome condensation (RCC1) repeat